MLYAKFVRAYTHTLRLHMTCTPFLVYTFAFTYDVHDILVYKYVIHSYIALHVALLYDWLLFLFIFNFFFLGVFNLYTQLCVLHLLGISLEYHILAHVARTFQLVYTRYILHITGIPIHLWIKITWMVLRGILVSLHFITAWSYPDVYPYYCIYTLCTVYTFHVLILSHWYTSLNKRWIMHTTWYIYSLGIKLLYNMYTSGFIFKGCLYDHPTFTLSQHNIFPIVLVACRCLLGGSRPPWGPGHQYKQLFPVFEGYWDNASRTRKQSKLLL